MKVKKTQNASLKRKKQKIEKANEIHKYQFSNKSLALFKGNFSNDLMRWLT